MRKNRRVLGGGKSRIRIALEQVEKVPGGFTLLELLVVIVIIATLAGLLFPALTTMISSARATVAQGALRDITNATINWSVDHGNRLPSPIYSGSQIPNGEEEEYNPTGTGLWCDGVVFKTLYPDTDPATPPPSRASEGGHLVDTVFQSLASVKTHTDDLNWYHHTYAMNKNLIYDELNAGADDPWLTEKSIANITYMTNAMIYIDSPNNVIDYEMAKDAADKESTVLDYARYRGKFVLAAFLDGHVERLKPGDFENLKNEELTRFWQGVDPKRAKP
jgi:prepilin-type N-terminal cleavage/methylation domain-containing protein